MGGQAPAQAVGVQNGLARLVPQLGVFRLVFQGHGFREAVHLVCENLQCFALHEQRARSPGKRTVQDLMRNGLHHG